MAKNSTNFVNTAEEKDPKNTTSSDEAKEEPTKEQSGSADDATTKPPTTSDLSGISSRYFKLVSPVKEIREKYYSQLTGGVPIAPLQINTWHSQLAILLGSVGEALSDAENDFNALKSSYLIEDGVSDAKAESLAKNSGEYHLYRKLKYFYKTTELLIQSMKRRERIFEEAYERE